jgi:hypothetical protein
LRTRDTWRFERPIDYMLYFFRMFELIENDVATSRIFLCGKLRQHASQCDKEGCACLSILEFLDDVKL